MDQLKYMKVWIIGGREQDCRLHFVVPTSKGGRTQSLSHASGVGGRFPLFAFESKLSTLTKKTPFQLRWKGICAQNRNRTCTTLR